MFGTVCYILCCLVCRNPNICVVRTKTNINVRLCIVWCYCLTVAYPGIQWGWGLCVPFHSLRTSLKVPLDHNKVPTQELIATNLSLLLLRSFVCCDSEKLRFVLRFLCYFGLISTNVDTPLNICDTVRRQYILKPFVHSVLMLDVSANDATQGTRHASRTNIQMVMASGEWEGTY